MAVDATEKTQNYNSPLKPSTLEANYSVFLGDIRRELPAVMVQGALFVHSWIAPWPGVIEAVRTTQLIAGGGAGAQNSITMTVDGDDAWGGTPTDGNTLLDDDVAGTSALTYPTNAALLVEQPDEVDRVEFALGAVIAVGAVAGAAAYGRAETTVVIARLVPQDI